MNYENGVKNPFFFNIRKKQWRYKIFFQKMDYH